MCATVVARDVKKSYCSGQRGKQHTTQVLNGISLSIEAGEMVSIVGPSGSGKSTLLYCLSGLETADSGSIEVMGKQVVKARRSFLSKVRRDHLGFVFQSYNLIPSLSVSENVALPARLAGCPMTKEQASEVLESVGLRGREKNRPGDLSGGEQQRVAIARVLASNPEVVFADEPTGALDSENSYVVLRMLRKIGNDSRRSVVVVTHDLEDASRADRVLVLRDGRIVKEMGRSSAAQIFDATKASA